MEKVYYDKIDGTRIHLNEPTKPMVEVKAYKCPYCGNLYNTNNRHYPCKYDPTALHCGDCVNGTVSRASYDDEGIGSPAFYQCKKWRMGRSPRKLKCEFYEKKEDKDITWRW